MRFGLVLAGAAAVTVSACGGPAPKSGSNAVTSNAAVAAPAQPAVAQTDPATPQGATPANATAPAAAAGQDRNRVETVERTASDGTRIRTRELVGPDVQPPGFRPLRADEVDEIEKATGRPYQEGDSIYGRAEPVKPK